LIKYLKIEIDPDLKIILLDHQNNHVKISSIAAKNFHISDSLNVLHNYFDSPTKLMSDLHSAKFLDTSTKLYPFRVSKQS